MLYDLIEFEVCVEVICMNKIRKNTICEFGMYLKQIITCLQCAADCNKNCNILGDYLRHIF